MQFGVTPQFRQKPTTPIVPRKRIYRPSSAPARKAPPTGNVYDCPIGPPDRRGRAVKSLSQFLYEIAVKHLVSEGDIRGERRHRHIMDVRLEFLYRAYSETNRSLPVIGRFLGDRDHSTMLSGIRCYAALHDLPVLSGEGQGGAYKECSSGSAVPRC